LFADVFDVDWFDSPPPLPPPSFDDDWFVLALLLFGELGVGDDGEDDVDEDEDEEDDEELSC